MSASHMLNSAAKTCRDQLREKLESALDAARQSNPWKSVFMSSVDDNGKKILYLRKENEREKDISDYLRAISRTKKLPFAYAGASLCGVKFDQDQMAALDCICNHPIVLIHGGPGSGKTTIPRELALRAEDAGLRIQGLTFMGKAAARLREHAKPIDANTIHKVTAQRGFLNMKGEPVKPPNIVVIDEAAMISNSVFVMALRLCPKDARLVIIGDGDQLEPLGAGAPFLQMIKSGKFPVIKLRGQHRSGEGVVEACMSINRGEFPESNGGFQFIERTDGEKLDRLARSVEGKDECETQIVTTSNAERKAVNKWWRETKGFQADRVYLGEKLTAMRNDYDTGAMNGEQGTPVNLNTVTSKGKKAFRVKYINTENEPDYAWPDHGALPDGLDFAYCITGNKCQGSEWDHIVCHLTGRHMFGRHWASRKWLYTVVSRGRKTVTLLGSRELIEKILNNGANAFRVSLLSNELAKL